ncbi:MAG: Bug family tripartite tricarboxylate transporter substrate binding protein [Pseudomonadota bacterium]
MFPGQPAGRLHHLRRDPGRWRAAPLSVPVPVAGRDGRPAPNRQEEAPHDSATPNPAGRCCAGKASAARLSMEYLKVVTGMFITQIPYRATGPMPTDLLAGRTQAASASLPALIGHIRSGKLRPIAVDTAQHLPQLPEVPRLAEHGYKDFETSQWYGTLAPAGTPRDIVGRLQEESLKALKSNAVTEPFASDGAVGDGGPPWEVAAFIGQQEIWKDIVLRAGIKPDQPDRGGRACAAPRTGPLPML